MMKFLLIILLSISFHARSAITFDSLFKESTFIVGGRVIHQEICEWSNKKQVLVISERREIKCFTKPDAPQWKDSPVDHP